MKKIYIFISLILFSVLNAQIVNIPDIHFKNVLLTTNYPVAKNSIGVAIDIDANNDGQIQSSEAAIVSELFLYKPDYWHTIVNEMQAVTSLEGIKGFVNLKKIYLKGFNSLTSIDMSNMTSLEEVRVDSNITLNSMNIQGCTSLNLVRTNFNKLTSLLLQGCSALTEIDCSDNQLQALDFSGNPSLYNLNASSNKLVSINLGNLPALQSANLILNNLNNVTFNNNTALRTLNLAYNNVSSLLFSQIPNLKGLNIAGNKFSTIDVSGLSQLESIQCSVNLLTTLDLSQNHNLMTFNCDSNYSLQSLFIKNGKNDFLSIYPSSFLNTPNLSYICVDDFEASNVTNLLPTQSNCVVNSYCSYVPGGTFYTIQGNIKYDSNDNGCDINDPSKSFQKFNITNGNTAGSIISNNTGNYSIPVQGGSHIITPVLENPTYFNISPANATANFPTQTSPLTQNFCLTANGTHNDFEIVVIPVNAARPGFEAIYKIIYKNKGTTTQSGTLAYNFNDNLMNYVSSTIAPNTQSTGILSWNFTNILPFETKEITLTFTLNTPTQTPPLNGGDLLHYTAQINGGTDDTPTDNI
uniref:leucine-rich repeat domain-containing protein n=1 Tax=Chryseobacterium sp. LAM-KRS1 TaxID=2715754 RepID=UPI001552ECE8